MSQWPPPTYLQGRVAIPRPDGPARHLLDGRWCGHGEATFSVFDIRSSESGGLSLVLPADLRYPALPAVAVESPAGERFLIYDPRQYTASVFAIKTREFPYAPGPAYRCRVCGCERFDASVGFEIPEDSSGPEDTSWFALAAQCRHCGQSGIIFDDETA